MKKPQKINALLEIGLEEVPARFMPAMIEDLKQKAEKELNSSRLTFNSIQTYGTPRRLVLYIEGLPAKQADLSKEMRGPQKQAAYSADGAPTKAAEGFAKGQDKTLSGAKNISSPKVRCRRSLNLCSIQSARRESAL